MQYFCTPEQSGSQNMQIDLKLFQEFEKGLIPPALRIYSWKPACISLGYSQKIDRLIDEEVVRWLGWEIVRRPTGGGIVFHNEVEVTYSLVTAIDDPILPDGLVPSYTKISQAIVRGLSLMGISCQILNSKSETLNHELYLYKFMVNKLKTQNSKFKTKTQNSELKDKLCFSYPADYEIMVDGRKLVGSAQKRGKRALLQQGSIFVRNDLDGIFSVLKEPIDKKWYANRAISIEEILGREVGFEELSQALVEGFKEEFNVLFKIKNKK